jgi:hypothetical protein
MRHYKTVVVLAHLLGWLLFMALPVFFIGGMSGIKGVAALLASPFCWVVFGAFIAFFYLHTLVLLPRLWVHSKLAYGFTMALTIAAVMYIKPFEYLMFTSRLHQEQLQMGDFKKQPFFMPGDAAFRPLPPPEGIRGLPPGDRLIMAPVGKRRNMFDLISMMMLLLVTGISTAVHANRSWRLAVKKAATAEADRANAELSFLKAQINPHFLFNTLNNIYTLAITKNEHTAECIMKLSNIMRYVTDEATEELVSLEDEIACISDYIDLQKLRLAGTTDIDYAVTGPVQFKKIAPLIFMSFVENVFKHGISNHEKATIQISISATEKNITFYSRNKLFPGRTSLDRKGIGISNTRKRLQHIYRNNYLLDINEANGSFTVQLTIQS